MKISSKHQPMGKGKSVFYRPELDLLRLLAFLMVFFHHGAPGELGSSHVARTIVVGSSSGLQLFFMLSAFLITELLLREREQSGTVALRSFYIRRVLRIWPLYFVFIGVVAALGRWTHFAPTGFLAYAFLVGNWYIFVHGFLPMAAMPLWSISVEEQFYVLWPPISKYGGKSALWVFSALSIAISYLTLAYLGSQRAAFHRSWTNSLVEFQFFGVGTLIALCLHGREPRITVIGRFVLLAAGFGGLYGASALFGAKESAFHLGLAYLLIALGSAVILVSIYGIELTRIADPLVYLGRISYGLYVFHYAVLMGVHRILISHGVGNGIVWALLSLAVTIVLAHLSYRFLESPFLRLKKRFALVLSRDELVVSK